MNRQLVSGVAFLIGVFITGSAWLKYKADKLKRRRIHKKALTRNQD